MFGKSSRFSGPGSYLAKEVYGSENVSANANMENYAGAANVKKTTVRRDKAGTPAYMQTTKSSIAKRFTPNAQGSPSSERLQFPKKEGAEGFGPTVEFGKGIKGTTPMKKGKHGRFSIADSYFNLHPNSRVDHCGLGHEDDKKFKKGTGASNVVPMRKEGERFGKGSYLESVKEDGPKQDFLNAHQDIFNPNDNKGTSAFRSKILEDRAEWIKEDTYLKDKDLANCEGTNRLPDARTEFEADNLFEGTGTATFKAKTERFPEPKLFPGQNSLGPNEPEAAKEPKFGTVYKKNTKHGRFSEFGGIYSNPE